MKTFWTTFRSHERKVALAQRDFGLQEPAEASYDHLLNLRERCLYVDVFHDGRTLTPNGLVQPGGLTAGFMGRWALWIREEIRNHVRTAAARKGTHST